MNQKKRQRITDAERKEAYKEASKFVLDLAKLIFAGVILGCIMELKIDETMLLLSGGTIVSILIIAGAFLYYKAIKKY